ncbi:DUF5134 domain-containing protein [Streptomyces mayteni]
MHGPAVVGWLVVALCGLTGGYCLLLARAGGGGARQAIAAGAEGVMGLGMAAMAVPVAAPWPPAFHVACAAVAVCGAALLVAEGTHRGHHLVEALAMSYAAVAMAGAPAAHAGHQAPAGLPVFTGVLLVYFAGYALRSAPRLLPTGEVVAAAGAVRRPPEVAAACRLALAVAMVAMLIGL